MITLIRERAIDKSIIELDVEDNQVAKFTSTGTWSVKDTTHADDKRKVSDSNQGTEKSSRKASSTKRASGRKTSTKKSSKEEIKKLTEG